MRLFSLVAGAALIGAGCSSSSPCQQFASAAANAASQAKACIPDAGLAFVATVNVNQCEQACSTVDQTALKETTSCLDDLPVCSASNPTAFEQALNPCGTDLLKVSTSCLSALAGESTTDAGTNTGGTMTIAAARAGNVTTPITVKGVVMGESGTPPSDVPQWYIEDPAGGPNSGVVVYCDPDLSCPTSIRAPGLFALVEVTGTLSTYMGDVQLVPTAQTVLEASTTPPPPETITLAQMSETGSSMYRGVYVKLSNAKLTVDDITPHALWDTECTSTVASNPDAGTYGEPVDAGMLQACAGLCEPPAYSGFQVNDGAGNEGFIEAPFFSFDYLQSSPECFTQPNAIPVNVGMVFTEMSGILDLDPYGQVQALYPIQNSSYTIQSSN